MLVLLTLAWWGYSNGTDGDWKGLAEDVAWVLEKMRDCEAPAVGSSKKRYVLILFDSTSFAFDLVHVRKVTDKGGSTEQDGEGLETRRLRRKDGGGGAAGPSTKR